MAKSRTPLDQRSRGWALLAATACLLPLLLQLQLRLAIGIGVTALAISALTWRRPLPGFLRVLLALVAVGAVFAAMGINFGRDTGCAMLAAMLAIKPAETSGLRDARSLIGFALFAPFATFLLDQGPLSLLLGLLAVTLALAALQRLAELESGDGQRSLPIWRRLITVGRMLVIGLPLALAAFWLFPRMASPLWGVPERTQARPGLSESMSPGQWQDLLIDDSPAARVVFFGPTPPQSQMYWRSLTLWNFDGRTWTQPPWLRTMAPAKTTSTASVWDYELELEATDRRRLVALDLPLAAPERAQLDFDYGLHVQQPLSEVTRWRMRSAAPAVFEPELRPILRRFALELPSGYNPRTLALARQWRREAGGNDAAIVQRALKWVTAEFAYTMDVPLPGRHAIDEFLFAQKAGYCEQFSSSFVVLMRAAGIPARVVTGYVGGRRNTIGDYWLLRRSDAHAWAEVWLPQRGWTRVDPTAAVAPERIFDTLADRVAADGGVMAQLTPMFDVGDWMRRGWNDFVLGFDAARQRQMLRPLGIDNIDPQQLLLVFTLVAILALLITLWLVTREARERDPVLRAWHRLGMRYTKLGLGREPHEPAGDWATRVLHAHPQATALAALSARFAEWRYAATSGGSAVARNLVRDLRAHRPHREA